MWTKKWRNFGRSVGVLWLNRGKYPKKTRDTLFGDYLRMFFLSMFLTKPIRERIKQISLLGERWEIFDLETTVALVEEIFVEHEYKPRKIQKKLSVLDLGGNIGLSVLYFKTICPAAKIWVFEPDGETFRVMKRNIERAGWKGVEMINMAVGGNNGEADFFVGKNLGSPLMSLYEERIDAKKIRVRMVKLSEWIKDKMIDLVKMDIEGAEMEVIKDLDEEGVLKQKMDLLIEYHHHLFAEKDRLGEFLRILEKNGYGYQLKAMLRPPFREKTVEDIMIWGYKK